MRAVLARWLRFALGLGLATLATYWILHSVNVSGLNRALEPFPWAIAGAACTVMLLNFGVRAARWWVLVRSVERDTSWWTCTVALFTSAAVNNIVPLRLGDALRVFAFPRLNLGPARLAGTLLVEKVLDVWSLVGIGALALTRLLDAHGHEWASIAIWMVWLVLGGLIIIFRYLRIERLAETIGAAKSPILRRIGAIASDIQSSMRLSSRNATLVPAMTLSLVAWSLEGLAFSLALSSTIPNIPRTIGWASMAAATLATLVPAAPGFVGTFEAAAMQPVVWAGAGSTEAAAFAVLSHVIVWLPVTAVGLALGLSAWMRGQIDLKRLRHPTLPDRAPSTITD